MARADIYKLCNCLGFQIQLNIVWEENTVKGEFTWELNVFASMPNSSVRNRKV